MMQPKCPLVTVVVPTYRRFKFLESTLLSIYSQDCPHIEILITDDGSDNYDEAFVQGLADQAPSHIPVRMIHHPQNLGTVKNLNYAIKQASGEFICFLGADDLLFEPSTLSMLIKSFKQDTAVITGKAVFVNEDGSPRAGGGFKYPSSLFYRLPCIVLYYYILASGNMFTAPGAIYRKSLFSQVGFYDEQFKYLEDFPYWVFLLRKGIPIGYVPQPLVRYRMGGISTGSNDTFQRILQQEEYQTYVREYKLLPGTFWSNILKELMALRIKTMLIECDIEGFTIRHLKHPLWVKVFKKGMALIKRIIGLFSFRK